jgi:hypothetical protein
MTRAVSKFCQRAECWHPLEAHEHYGHSDATGCALCWCEGYRLSRYWAADLLRRLLWRG